MSNVTIIKKKIKKFSKVITVSGDKSLSIRWVLFSSLANGVSKARNLLMSEDVIAAIKAIKVLGIKSKFEKINIDYFQSKNEEILKLLKGNEVDFIITNSLINDTDLDVMVLYYEPLMILIPDDLKSNKTDIIELKNINTDKLIVPNSSDLRKTINKLFDFKKFNSKISSNSLLSLFNLSYSGLGMTVVPFLNYRSLNKEKRNKVYHFKKPYPSRKISIVYKKNNLKKHMIIEMSELIKSKLKSIETFSDVKIIDTIN